MTREEARKELRIIAVELTGKLGATTDEQEAYALSRQINAIDVALDALWPVSREQVEKAERMRGEWVKPQWRNSTSCAVCSQCGFEAYHHEYHGVQDTYLFCPRCMAPMTDEAVQLFLKRIEALRGGEDMP